MSLLAGIIANIRWLLAHRSQAADEITRKLTNASRELADVTRELAKARAATQTWKETAAQYRRRLLSTAVIRETFERRARTLPARAAIPAREQREAALRAASPAYVAAVEWGPASFGEHVHHMTVQGLQWWMPIVRPGSGGPSPRWVEKQRLPYGVLTKTRELAIGGIMLDLGANIGRMSIPRVMLGDVVAAYCAEPDPLNYACLVGNAIDNGLNGLVLPDRVAIGDTNGTVTLGRAKVSSGHRVLPDGAGESSDDRIEVPSLTLDTWLARLRVDLDAINFVKVDVQGFEMRVLAGAPALLAKRHVAWQLEINPALLASAGSSLPDACARLEQHFGQFIDLNKDLTGPRERSTRELAEALAYLGSSTPQTDLLVF